MRFVCDNKQLSRAQLVVDFSPRIVPHQPASCILSMSTDSNTPVAVLRAEVSERLRVDASRLKASVFPYDYSRNVLRTEVPMLTQCLSITPLLYY